MPFFGIMMRYKKISKQKLTKTNMKKLLSVMLGLTFLVGFAGYAMAEDNLVAVGDTTVPSDVDNAKAIAGDSMVRLTWEIATDNVKVTGYKIYYGPTLPATAADKFTFGPVDAGDVLKYDVTALENGTKYYFAITAYDAAGNESANYAVVSSTPKAGLGGAADTEAPMVVKAEAVDKIDVEVEFSEKIELPELHPEQAFTVENDATLEPLEILNAEIMKDEDVEKGQEGKMVKLTTAVQTKDANYVLTATIDVQDLSGNPIISGTSDTAPFVGSALEPAPKDVAGPQVTKVEVLDKQNLLVTFNESVVLGLEPAKNFEVYLSGTTKEGELTVSSVTLGNDTVNGVTDAAVALSVSEMASEQTYTLEVVGVKDKAANDVDPLKNKLDFKSPLVTVDNGNGQVDTPLPELKDAEKFAAKVVNENDTLSVLLSWTLPKGEASRAQKIYRSLDKGANYTKEEELSLDSSKYSVSKGLEAGKDYYFKLTQIGADGTESKGVTTKVRIPETGPGIVGLLLASAGVGRYLSRRKKN